MASYTKMNKEKKKEVRNKKNKRNKKTYELEIDIKSRCNVKVQWNVSLWI